MKIYIDTDQNPPCGRIYAPCRIVAEDGRDIVVDTDWDYPGFADTFGWSVRNVQKCPACGKIINDVDYHAEKFTCEDCQSIETGDTVAPCCEHSTTDGTVDCRECGLSAGDFIPAAGRYLEDNDGAEADDPGYFDAD